MVEEVFCLVKNLKDSTINEDLQEILHFDIEALLLDYRLQDSGEGNLFSSDIQFN